MVKTYENAVCLPCTGVENTALYPNANGGVFDNKHQPVEDAFLRREYRQNIEYIDGKWDRTTGQILKHHKLILPGEITGDSDRLQGTYIFAGYLFPHYGHFLLESLANLWFIKENPDTPIIWLGVHNQSDLSGMNRQFLALHDINNPIHILNRETEIENLIVPEPGYLIHTRYSDAQMRALKVLDAPEITKGKKIWLSRSALELRSVINEKNLEKILIQHGWEIYHPEKYPIKQQLLHLSDAEVIAGIEGSAFHQLMMIPEFKGKLIIFARRQRIEFDFVIIAEQLGFDQDIFYPDMRIWSYGLMHWEYCRFWLRLDPILEALGITQRSSTPIAPPTDNLGKIANGLVNYFKFSLAIEFWNQNTSIATSLKNCRTLSVSTDRTFGNENLPNRFDHLDITADQFYTKKLLRTIPDLICFRHHGDEQTLFRGFHNSITESSDSMVWLIEYYADERFIEPKNKCSHKDRIASMNTQLVKYIANCFPMLSINRIRGANVAIVWKEPRQMFESQLHSIKELEDYPEFERAPIVSLTETATAIEKNRSQ